MSPTLTCLVLAVMGVDVGYQPSSPGKVEFIIQISPAMLQAIAPGRPIELDLEREAQELRASRFLVTVDKGSLPHIVPPVAMSQPPAQAPSVAATPVMPAIAMTPAANRDPQSGQPVTIPPPSAAGQTATGFGSPQASAQEYSPGSAASPVSREAGIPPLAQPNSGTGAPGQRDHPWLAMCLLVIALAASNGYLGWLFWDARTRYLDLVRQNFAAAPRAAEA